MSIPPIGLWNREDTPRQEWNGRFSKVTTFILNHKGVRTATIFHRPDNTWEVYTYTGSPTVCGYGGTFDTLEHAQARALDLAGIKR